jgi:glycosyl transferase, family 25
LKFRNMVFDPAQADKSRKLKSAASGAAIPAFIINLNRDASRWQNISRALRQLNVPYERVSAIDARKRIGLVRRVIHSDFQFAPANRALTDGEICCYLSHMAALRRVVRQNLDMAMIFEDDVIFDGRFPAFYQDDLPRFLMASDIVKFEGIHYPHTSKSGISIADGKTAQLVLRLKPTLGAAAYAVTRSGASALIKALSVVDRPFDLKLAYYDRHWVSYAETQPFLASQASYASNLESEREPHYVEYRPLQGLGRFQRKLAAAGRGAMRLSYIAKFLVKRRLASTKSPASIA